MAGGRRYHRRVDPRERNRRRRFGQNDLVDPVVRERLVAAIERTEPLAGSGLLEIGAGDGALTALLLARRPALLAAVEIDPERLARLGAQLGGDPALRPIAGDATERTLLAGTLGQLPAPRRVVGSLPYNVATPILDALLDAFLDTPFLDAHVVVQREVADRLVAHPRTGAYGYFSLVTQLRATPAVVARIPPSAFRPRPNVESSLVRLVPRQRPEGDFAALRAYLSRAFGMRRKMLRNALGEPGAAAILESLGIRGDARAEELAPAEHVAVWQRLAASGAASDNPAP